MKRKGIVLFLILLLTSCSFEMSFLVTSSIISHSSDSLLNSSINQSTTSNKVTNSSSTTSNKITSTTSNKVTSSNTNTINSSSNVNPSEISEISEMIKNGSGIYQIKGIITKKVSTSSSTSLYLENFNRKTNCYDHIFVDNLPSSFITIHEGIEVKVKGNYSLNNDIPTLTYSSLEILNNVPQQININKINSFSGINVNQYVEIENVRLSKKTNYIFTLDNQEYEIIYDLASKSNLEEVFSSSISNNSNISLKGIVSVKDNKICLKMIDNYDVLYNGKKSVSSSRDVTLYGLNDFHGSIKENGNEKGLLKVGSFFKRKGQEDNTLILSQGDMFQGSIESNYNRGNLITDVMNDIQFDCFTLGNHEFDWGQEYIISNRNRKGPNGNDENGYQTPYLSANIYDFDINTKKVGNFNSSLGGEYVIKELENGLKIGIIGIIGEGQITSITSRFVDNITFKNQTKVVQQLSNKLRNEEKVDLVVLSAHANASTLLGGSTTSDKTGITNYVDAVFCAHSHYREYQLINGVPFVQGGDNGEAYSSISLSVSEDGTIKVNDYSWTYTSNIPTYYNDITIGEIINKYSQDTSVIGSEKLGSINGKLTNDDNGNLLPNLVTKAIADYTTKQNISVDYVVVNDGRDTLSSGNITYGQLFKSIPFDNDVYIIKALGSELRNEIKYNYMYRFDENALSNNKIYTVAVLDYLATHRNSSRDYDYFPTFTYISTLLKDSNVYNYRDITAYYIRENKSLNASDYASTLDVFNKNKLSSAI